MNAYISRTVRVSATLLMLTACEGRFSRTPWLREGDTPLRDVERMGALDSRGLLEGSGIVASPSTPGVLWALNDSGNEPDLFALTPHGHVRAVLRVEGAKNRDWEALGVGPCPEGECLYAGDVGDNDGQRKSLQVYRVREPAVSAGTGSVRSAEPIIVRFADGGHDVEAMYVAPDTSIWFITKRPRNRKDGSARPVHLHRLLRAQWATGTPLAIEDSLPITPESGPGRDWVTDASLSTPDASGKRRLAVLTYGAVYVFDADALTGKPGALVQRCAIPVNERSAEGVTWLADGRVLLLSEGVGEPLYAGRCP